MVEAKFQSKSIPLTICVLRGESNFTLWKYLNAQHELLDQVCLVSFRGRDKGSFQFTASKEDEHYIVLENREKKKKAIAKGELLLNISSPVYDDEKADVTTERHTWVDFDTSQEPFVGSVVLYNPSPKTAHTVVCYFLPRLLPCFIKAAIAFVSVLILALLWHFVMPVQAPAAEQVEEPAEGRARSLSGFLPTPRNARSYYSRASSVASTPRSAHSDSNSDSELAAAVELRPLNDKRHKRTASISTSAPMSYNKPYKARRRRSLSQPAQHLAGSLSDNSQSADAESVAAASTTAVYGKRRPLSFNLKGSRVAEEVEPSRPLATTQSLPDVSNAMVAPPSPTSVPSPSPSFPPIAGADRRQYSLGPITSYVDEADESTATLSPSHSPALSRNNNNKTLQRPRLSSLKSKSATSTLAGSDDSLDLSNNLSRSKSTSTTLAASPPLDALGSLARGRSESMEVEGSRTPLEHPTDLSPDFSASAEALGLFPPESIERLKGGFHVESAPLLTRKSA
eukprot:Colp12_sorted_trinity150504_noHs@31247